MPEPSAEFQTGPVMMHELLGHCRQIELTGRPAGLVPRKAALSGLFPDDSAPIIACQPRRFVAEIFSEAPPIGLWTKASAVQLLAF